ncbi:hypothetical protein GCM10007874_32540 [Labrys miyagiensis]|uniref:Ornithine cyclodeaminase n=2 Tax=Labrys miyagiensis TaxID=346912 RepID=A0ABQ6CIR4_9HYPH|nr:hypothetical protein GCM10007874_32540 [Labrys miyagiensis]
MPSIQRVHYLTRTGRPDRAFETAFGHLCELRHAHEVDAAVSDSDVVVTATPGGGPLFPLAAVRPGTHINCVGTDTKGKQELPEGLLRRTRLFADDCDQSRSIGECQWDAQCPMIAIGDILTNKVAFTRRPDDITVFDMTGLALQDLTVAEMLWQQAKAKGHGTTVAWPW